MYSMAQRQLFSASTACRICRILSADQAMPSARSTGSVSGSSVAIAGPLFGNRTDERLDRLDLRPCDALGLLVAVATHLFGGTEHRLGQADQGVLQELDALGEHAH